VGCLPLEDGHETVVRRVGGWCGMADSLRVGCSVCELEDCCRSVFVSSCCYKFVGEARRQFGNKAKGERLPFEADEDTAD
jgi:hypothetical protein